ncbi:hypothetical protein RFI_16880 [Reticulomyxa filosa]|uniref:Uncharacterized protein n=1 Tax=Reticulomyxa filosa TaxID=46433 RepID=X6N4U6_RETFI|nr:hypothetical protein RFI_16880 [Reticulomyxa filosa]|eukprot:ETO20337.1 hypothetical protein RFI_16880 [Reticulomyxa filosa]
MDDNDDAFSFRVLINDEHIEIEEMGLYCLYVIKSKIIILNEITIDGNVYVVNCEIRCKGNNVNITTQLYVTNHAIISQSLIQSMSPIQWNAKMHHDILVQMQHFQDKVGNYANDQYEDAVSCLNEALQFAMDNFGVSHPLIGLFYCFIGVFYRNASRYDEAIAYFETALHFFLNIFGNIHLHIGNTLYNLGSLFFDKADYDTAIECYEYSLKIRKYILKINDIYIGNCCWELGVSFEQKGNLHKARQYYEESWKTYNKEKRDSMSLLIIKLKEYAI